MKKGLYEKRRSLGELVFSFCQLTGPVQQRENSVSWVSNLI